VSSAGKIKKGDNMRGQFLDLNAAADFIGPGAIEINRYQTEIFDIVRRRGAFGQRIKQVPATGHPSRFFEETAIPSPTAAQAFMDPRNIVPTIQSPTRVELSVPLKALVSQINYNLIDLEVGAQQSQFAYLQAKDLADTVDGLLRTHDVALWNGNDTSLSAPTTMQYFGAIGQIEAGVYCPLAMTYGSVPTLRQAPAIASEWLPRIFDKFFRAPNAPTGGSGLGLTIVKGFVEAHGGSVSANNRPGGGASFSLRLPQPDKPPTVEPG
jgi:hypothetical protein